LITADEIVAAGSGKYAIANSSYYLNKGSWYWSFSPNNTPNAYVFFVNSTGDLNRYSVGTSVAVAPVINLGAEYLDKLQGNGTINNPYFLSTGQF